MLMLKLSMGNDNLTLINYTVDKTISYQQQKQRWQKTTDELEDLIITNHIKKLSIVLMDYIIMYG